MRTVNYKSNERIYIGKKSPLHFASVYLDHYLSHKFPSFHFDLSKKLDDDEITRLLAIAFRESAKSVFAGLIYPLQCICYKKRNFIIYASDSGSSASNQMAPLIHELQTNTKIKEDFGELFLEPETEFKISKKKTIRDFVTANDIRVLGVGIGTKVRGERHLQYRPDLLICDDMESSDKMKSELGRKRAYDWLKTEALPAMNQDYGKAVVIGNMLHYDCLVARLEKEVKPDGIWDLLKVPIRTNNHSNWPSRYVLTDSEAKEINSKLPEEKRDLRVISIEKIKQDKGTLVYNQEYQLIPLKDEDSIIKRSWVRYYDQINPQFIKQMVIAIDPAVSEKQTADKTAITVWARNVENNYYLLDFINERLSFDKQVRAIRNVYRSYQEFNPVILLEDVAYQQALRQHLVRQHGLPVKPVKPKGDKRSRLMEVSVYFENGLVFVKKNHDDVIAQLINFGFEKHDDLVDSTIYGIKGLSTELRLRGHKKTNLKL